MEKTDLELRIVQVILRDMMGRFGLDAMIKNGDPHVDVDMFEKWRHLISVELKKQGLVDKVYDSEIDAKQMGFWEAVMKKQEYLIGDDE